MKLYWVIKKLERSQSSDIVNEYANYTNKNKNDFLGHIIHIYQREKEKKKKQFIAAMSGSLKYYVNLISILIQN